MWQALIPVATAGLGAIAGDEQADQRKNWNNAAAETNRYAGIRGHNGRVQGGGMQLQRGGPTALSGGIQGAMAGMDMAKGAFGSSTGGGMPGKTMSGGGSWSDLAKFGGIA